MKKIFRPLLFLLISVNALCQDKDFVKKSNNLTLNGNVEFINKNLIEAESFYREAISKDSLNNIASYNMANSFYKSGLKMEAVNEYKSSIFEEISTRPLQQKIFGDFLSNTFSEVIN